MKPQTQWQGRSNACEKTWTNCRQQLPRSYPMLVDIAAKYERAKNEEIAQGGTLVHGSYPDRDKVDSQTTEQEESRFRSKPRIDRGKRKNPMIETRDVRRRFEGQYSTYTPLKHDTIYVFTIA
ncbi:hypothetical protein QYF36_003617 [Acer negundo]|nr:hypothetical protein QYF36_003617 [Acer negundo]